MPGGNAFASGGYGGNVLNTSTILTTNTYMLTIGGNSGVATTLSGGCVSLSSTSVVLLIYMW